MSSLTASRPRDGIDNPKRRLWVEGLHKKASKVHSKVPYVNRLPFSAVAIIALLVLVNIAAWAIAIIALVSKF
jgi:high-affinity nickel-transport protein